MNIDYFGPGEWIFFAVFFAAIALYFLSLIQYNNRHDNDRKNN